MTYRKLDSRRGDEGMKRPATTPNARAEAFDRQKDIWQRLAQSHLENGETKLAEDVYRHLAREYPLFEPGRSGLARALLLQGRLEEARTEALQMAQHRALYGSAKLILCEVSLREVGIDEARRHLEDAVRYSPYDKGIFAALCRYFFAFGPPCEAEAALREWVRRYPDDDVGQCNLATVLLRSQQFTEAERLYRKTLELNPRNATARHNLSWLTQGSSADGTLIDDGDAGLAARETVDVGGSIDR